MKPRISIAAAAALLAGAAAVVAQSENSEYRWVHDNPDSIMCTAMLNGPGEENIGPITGSVETGYRGYVYYVFSARSDDWPIVEERNAFPIEIGFDGGAGRTRIEEAWGWTPGGIQFELEDSVRQRLGSARTVEFYRNGRRLGSVPLNGLGTALESIRTCAEREASYTGDATDAVGTAVENTTEVTTNTEAAPNSE